MLYTTLRIIFAVIFQLLFRAKTYGKENLPAEGPVRGRRSGLAAPR